MQKSTIFYSARFVHSKRHCCEHGMVWRRYPFCPQDRDSTRRISHEIATNHQFSLYAIENLVYVELMNVVLDKVSIFVKMLMLGHAVWDINCIGLFIKFCGFFTRWCSFVKKK